MIENNPAQSIHDSFNARTLTTTALCDSFIINNYFPILAGPNHSIMIGPRGSGKTTLMKMLQVEALDYWSGSEASEYRRTISFSGVFIPTDRLWKQQYLSLTQAGEASPETKNLLNSIFLLHVLERFVGVLEFRTSRTDNSYHEFKKIIMPKTEESELTRELAKAWDLTPSIFSLRSLKLSLSEKKVRLSTQIRRSQTDHVEAHLSDIVPTLEHAVTVANSYLNEPDEKWCFLFDELELAPESLVQPLIDAIRGGPDNIIFKLSLSPYHGDIKIVKTIESPMERQDFSLIDLSQANKKDGEKFSKALCEQIFKRNGYNDNIENYLEVPAKFDIKETFQSLSKKDSSFAHYLNDQNIEIGSINNYKENEKRTLVRKIQFVAYLRNFYLNESGRLRSVRRAPDYYAGFPRLCQAMEYNPRMLIGMTNSLLDALDGSKNKITIQAQIKILEDSIRSFKALLNTIPTGSKNFATVFSIVDHLGKFISKKYIKGEKFYSEPLATFLLENEPNSELVQAIGHGLNAGAFIKEPSKKDSTQTSDSNFKIRFRLSYVFAHEYGLLLSATRHLSFPDIKSKEKVIKDSKGQISLL